MKNTPNGISWFTIIPISTFTTSSMVNGLATCIGTEALHKQPKAICLKVRFTYHGKSGIARQYSASICGKTTTTIVLPQIRFQMNKKLEWFAAGILFAVLWASASTATKIGLSVAQPLVIAVVRFGMAAVILLFLAHLIMKHRLPAGNEWKQLAAYGFLNITVY